MLHLPFFQRKHRPQTQPRAALFLTPPTAVFFPALWTVRWTNQGYRGTTGRTLHPCMDARPLGYALHRFPFAWTARSIAPS